MHYLILAFAVIVQLMHVLVRLAHNLENQFILSRFLHYSVSNYSMINCAAVDFISLLRPDLNWYQVDHCISIMLTTCNEHPGKPYFIHGKVGYTYYTYT